MAEKKIKKSENKDLPVSTQTLVEKKKELRKLRFDNALGQLSDSSKIKKTRKEVARILTKMKKEGLV